MAYVGDWGDSLAQLIPVVNEGVKVAAPIAQQLVKSVGEGAKAKAEAQAKAEAEAQAKAKAAAEAAEKAKVPVGLIVGGIALVGLLAVWSSKKV